MGIEKFDELIKLVQDARQQYEEFAAGKKVAAIRARQRLQEIKRLAQDIRIEVQGMKKPTEKKAEGTPEQKPETPAQ